MNSKKVISLALALVMMLALTSCGKKPLTAKEYVDGLKSAGLPIGTVVDYATRDEDPNGLLGLENQYISKTNFADTTLEQLDPTSPVGGSVEVFADAADAKARKEYIDSIGIAFLAEISFINGNALLRLDKNLSDEAVQKYKDAFMAM